MYKKDRPISWLYKLIVDDKVIGIFPNRYAGYEHLLTRPDMTEPFKHRFDRVAA